MQTLQLEAAELHKNYSLHLKRKNCSPSQGVSTLIYSTRTIQQKNKGSFTKLHIVHILLSFLFIMLCYETHLLLSA